MTNIYDAGQATINLAVNTGDVQSDLKKLENLFQLSGLKAGQLFGENASKEFKATLDPKPIGEGFRKSFN